MLSSLGAITALIFAGRTDPKLSLRGVHMSVRMSVCVCVCVCVCERERERERKTERERWRETERGESY